MIAKFETDDKQEMMRLVKSSAMANFIFELVYNTDKLTKCKILDMLEEHDIKIDELTG
jgi:hypothetical protein